MLAATNFFTTEVWTVNGLVTYYVLFVMHVATRRVHIAGVTPFPNEPWMMQVARNLTMADVGFLVDHRYLIHDRDGKYCPGVRHHPPGRRRDTRAIATPQPEPESARGAVDPISQRRVLVEAVNRTGFLGDLIAWEDGVYGTSKSVFSGGA